MAKDSNIPVTGMVDVHPMNMKDSQYPFMLNGNIQTDITAAVTLTNEHSNFLCRNMPTGYKVIGTLYEPTLGVTFLWLVKPDPFTVKSQIGYISQYSFTEAQDYFVPNPCNECDKKKQEATPLEDTEQVELCEYSCITAADCLAFDIDFPIRKGVFKKDNCGGTLYFTDFKNPVRYLKLTPELKIDDTQRTVFEDITCGEVTYNAYCTAEDLNCDAIRLFPRTPQINVKPVSVGLGGALSSGTYQLAACYADQNGQRATRTFAISNPVPIFDPARTLTDQIVYPTDLAIKFRIDNLNITEYKYINVFAVATISGVPSYREYATIYIGSVIDNSLEYVLTDFEKGKDSSIDQILQIFPVYEKAQEITTAGNTLILGNLTGPRDLNLQPVIVSKLSPKVKWATMEVREDFYADGANAANYAGFMRDEVYPVGIVFERDNTLDTCAYALVGRASGNTDVEIISNKDVFKYPGCDVEALDKRWEVYNTASTGNTDCIYTPSTAKCITITNKIFCSSYSFKSTTVVIGATTGTWVNGQTVGDGTYTGVIIDASHQNDTLAYLVLNTATVGGEMSGTLTGPSGTAAIVSFVMGETAPDDCYTVDPSSGTCASNYPSIAPNSSASPTCPDCTEFDPTGKCYDASGNYTPFTGVRTQTDAAASLVPLCVDSQLATYQSELCEPYVYKTKMEQVEAIPMTSKEYNHYNDATGSTSNVYTVFNPLTPTPPNPTPVFQGSSPYVGSITPTALNNGTWLFPEVFSPVINNQVAQGALVVPPVFGPTGCIEYGSSNTATLYTPGTEIWPSNPRYFLGVDVASATGCTDPDVPGCTGATDPDYWGIGSRQLMAPSAERNNTPYQSRWYQVKAQTAGLVIKMKLGFPDSTYIQAQGDIRIDVYEANPFNDGSINPRYSSGYEAAFPADCYPADATYRDNGVLVIGDVGADPTFYNDGQQLPLIQNNVYWVHFYIVPSSAFDVWLQTPPDCNLNSCQGGTECNPGVTTQPCCSWPCTLAKYAWANLCIDYPDAEQVVVTTPAVSRMSCDYEVVYRENQVPDDGCNMQPYQRGEFAFWQAADNTYPTTTYVDATGGTQPMWGDVCGQPIRHFKFPDCFVSPVQDEDTLMLGISGRAATYVPNNGRMAKMYPLGIYISPEDVKDTLDEAVTLGLITASERASITGYKIVRGNRSVNKSVIAKGLIYDMWRYQQYDWLSEKPEIPFTYFPSYPFNDFRNDPYLYAGVQGQGNLLAHPYQKLGNTKYAFLSPDTTFNRPSLGEELKIEAVNFGDSLGKFYEVKNHPRYVLLGQGGIGLAIAMAALEEVGDFLVEIGNLYGSQWVGFSSSIPVGFIMGIVGAILQLPAKLILYIQQWEQIVKNFGVPFNFARYYAAVGNYHSSGETGKVPNDLGDKRRRIYTGTYLTGGNLSLQTNGVLIKINNYEREDSVYIDLGNLVNILEYGNTALTNTVKGDFSRFILSSSTDNNGPACALESSRGGTVASMYASVKAYQPNQYGRIHDVEWLYTGYYQKLEDFTQDGPCIPIYGGDIYISRMTQKRKMPFFLDNTVGVTTGIDSQYQRISNITNCVYFFNSSGESALNSSAVQLQPTEQNLDCYLPKFNPASKLIPIFIKGYMYLFSYGITSFLCESEFNLNYRYAKDTKVLDFYPHQSDIDNWTQEALIPIYNPNSYFYNRDYSTPNNINFFCTQPAIYSNADCITTYKNRVITSIEDKDSDFYNDNWRVFLVNDYKDFSLSYGDLNGLDGIEKDKVMVRFGNTTQVFNAFYTMDTNAGTVQVGTGNMFAQKPEEYVKSELGYGGTDNHAFVSTAAGHFWADAKRHNVFYIPPASNSSAMGNSLSEISGAYSTFFRNNLPFYIIQDFPTFVADNPYKNVGISLVWDNKFNRLFLTKLDYQLLTKWKGIVIYEDGEFLNDDVIIQLTDTNYFCDKSWTIAYSPEAKSWIGFYSFLPNYYIGHENYFQSGINYTRPGADSLGVWNHLISNKSYQVFYGKLYPFITDVIVQEQQFNKQLQSLEYQADFLRFQNDYDYYYNPGVTFNRMVIWSENQNSGNLVLVPQVKNDLSQAIRYPITNVDSTTVLVTRKENSWRVNQFCDLVADKYSNVPPMTYGCSTYLKEVNPDAIKYNKVTFQRQHLVSDYFTTRFINDEYSNYKIINKWFLNNTIKSIT